jgi:rhodanese-related sulfurtransferase
MKNPIYYLFIIGLFFTSCLGQHSDKYQSIDAKEFSTLINKEQNVQLLDVRSPAEYADSHIEKAVNVNWNGDDFTTEAQKFNKVKPVYVYCMSGGRSKKASDKLHELGFKTIIELGGGISEWKTNKMPVIK